MPEVQTPAPVETVTPAAEPAARPTPEQASQAGKTLAQIKKDIGAKLDAADKPKPEPEKKAEPAPEKKNDTKQLVGLVVQQRKLEKQRKETEERAKDADARLARSANMEKAESLAKSGDFIGALKLLGADKDKMYKGEDSVFMRLAAAAKAASEGGDTRTPEQIEADRKKEIEDKVQEALNKKEEERKAAEAKAAEEQRQARVQAAFRRSEDANKMVGDFMNAEIPKGGYPFVEDQGEIPDVWVSNPEYVGRAATAKLRGLDDNGNPIDFKGQGNPALGKYVASFSDRFAKAFDRKPTQREIREHLDAITTPGFYEMFYEREGKWPQPKDCLDYFEGKFKERAEKLSGRVKPAPAAPVQDTRTIVHEEDDENAYVPAITERDRATVGGTGRSVKEETYAQAKARVAAGLK